MKKIAATLLVTFLIIAGCAGGCELMNRSEYINGSRVGHIIKFSKRGIFWKTYQGEANMGGALNNSMGGASPNIWYFSLDNERRHGENLDSLIVVINRFLASGHPVKISYYAPYFSWPWRSNNRFLVQQVDGMPVH